MDNCRTICHESYGKIAISKVSGGSGFHFGSKIKTTQNVRLEIRSAEVELTDTGDHIFSKRELIEVEMTPNQFAELISVGMSTTGVPCTIIRKDGKMVSYKHPYDFVGETESNIKYRLKNLADLTKDALTELDKILANKKSPSKKDLHEIRSKVYMTEMEVRSNIDFYLRKFKEDMAEAVVEAKSELMHFSDTNKLESVKHIKMLEE